MYVLGRALLVAVVIMSIRGLPAECDEPQMAGVVTGRTGDILHVSLPQPVRDGTILTVKVYSDWPAASEAKVLSCTKEMPYIALAKVIKADMESPTPICAYAYVNADAVSKPDAPKPLETKRKSRFGSDNRLSLQAGAFYPKTPTLRETNNDVWPAYRLNYSFLKIGGFEGMLSTEYTKGTRDIPTDAGLISRTTEIIPVTLLGKFSPTRMGNTRLFVGGGGGFYRITSEDKLGGSLTSTKSDELGYEFSAGLELNRSM
ncbi:MAG: hypothetical protein Q7N50_08375, partial [Armatimonadota bacterium]|nr:hypothetical protein [Armatimonadota bacterium]